MELGWLLYQLSYPVGSNQTSQGMEDYTRIAGFAGLISLLAQHRHGIDIGCPAYWPVERK